MSDWSTLKEARPLHSMNTPAEVWCSNGIREIDGVSRQRRGVWSPMSRTLRQRWQRGDVALLC